MPIPIINWDNQAIQEIPNEHRTPNFIAWIQGFFSGTAKWLNKNFYNYCFGDLVNPVWNSAVTYSLNDVVVTYFGTWISIQNSNTANSPQSSPTYWYQISTSYIGALEIASYNSQRMNMEFGLNKYFFTTYRNPTTIVSGGYTPLSDIYITTVAISNLSFVSYTTEVGTSASFTNYSGSNAVFTGVVTGIDSSYQFIVHVPTGLATLLGVNYDSIIRSKVDKVNPLGISYSIVLY